MLSKLLSISLLLSAVVAAPLQGRKSACFIVGNNTLPADTQTAVNRLVPLITCSAATTIHNVPDVSSGGISFSSINFSTSNLTALDFALTTFKTASPLESSDLETFENQVNVYVATEAGLRSNGGSLKIKVPKFFLAFQVARIKTAQGIQITEPGQTVEHLLGKVLKNAAGESAGLKAQVTALSTELC